jgi:hypothetical protein
MKLNATDLGAKLLATENITVVRNRTRTASFDIKSRVLTLPQWKDMTPEVEEMLVGHEVGHALYTDEEYLKPIDDNRRIMQYLNVIEDVRIEKLIKRKYPGLRKTMNEGYKQLNDRDFFGVSKIPSMDALILIDKINLYFKAGFNCGVKFTSEEKPFVVRAEKTETVDDVIQLAQEIYEFSKDQVKKRKEKISQDHEEQDDEDLEDEEYGYDDDDIDGESDYDDDDFDEDGLEDEEDDFKDHREKRGAGGRSEDKQEAEEAELEQQLESKTEEMFSKKLEELADESTVYNYYNLDEKYTFNPIISYKKIIAETASVDEELTEYDLKELVQFKTDSSRVVNYLVKEFEMRKSATLYKRAQTSKIGSLDMKKVWAYKLNDDIFKRVTTLPIGKNHGMIFLLDWSGSMDHVLRETVQQVINLAMFCQRAQIPYQVFAFTTQYDVLSKEEECALSNVRREFYEQNKKLSNAVTAFGLMELFSSKMSNVEFNTMIRRLINPYRFIRSDRQFGTGGTPLNEALAYIATYIPTFTKSHNIEKLSLITLTDGEGGPLAGGHTYLESQTYERNANDYTYKRINQKHFLQDPITKKSYEMFRESPSQTEAILRLIKDRYNINSVGFYITPNNKRALESVVKTNIPGFQGSYLNMVDIMRGEFRDKGFASLKNTGRDDLFIVPTNKLNVETNNNMEVSEKDSASKIARNFGKLLNGKKTSRVLLNQFIGYVA